MGKRVKGIRIFFMMFLALLGARALYIQVVTPDRILTLAHKKFDYNIKLSAYRGGMYDKSGQPLAISLDVKSIAANPRIVENPRAAAAKLARALNLSEPSVRRRLASTRYFT